MCHLCCIKHLDINKVGEEKKRAEEHSCIRLGVNSKAQESRNQLQQDHSESHNLRYDHSDFLPNTQALFHFIRSHLHKTH